jgi:hypothetical protein
MNIIRNGVTKKASEVEEAIILEARAAAQLDVQKRERAVATPGLSPRQLRLALLSTGTTEAGVDAMIDAIPDTAEKEWARIEWKYATSFTRDHPLVLSIGASLGYPEAQIDTLWEWAAAL